MAKPTLFGGPSRSLAESIEETAALLNEYGPRYDHWAVAYSGGKDSSAALTVVGHLVGTGAVAPPRRLSVLYADTRMELPPLHAAAVAMLDLMAREGHDAAAVLPPMDDRFFVYMFGRGVPPPSNTFRWCTDQLKIAPMADALRALSPAGKVLMLTGVRIGESARRDQTIAAACSRDGAECGQGRLHLSLAGSKENDINRYFIPGRPADPCDTLAPVLHWRVCHVWDWLLCEGEAPTHRYADLTEMVAEAYGDGGGSSLVESAARTGCVGCNLASRDVALDRLVRRPDWAHLAPLKRLREMYAELKRSENRLRKAVTVRWDVDPETDETVCIPIGVERRQDGTPVANVNRMGPLTLDARRRGLAQVLAIQAEVCAGAARVGKPPYSLIDPEEEARIIELIAAGTWPRGWDGTEPRADEPFVEMLADGSVQQTLFG